MLAEYRPCQIGLIGCMQSSRRANPGWREELMAMAAGGDLLMQCLEELRELQHEVKEGQGRTEDQLTQVKQDVGLLQRTVNALAGNLSTLADSFHNTKLTHERYFDKIGRTLNMLAEQQLQNRDLLDDHERRLRVLEKR